MTGVFQRRREFLPLERGTEVYDVIVVGAGPVGSYLAYRLGKQGYKVSVFERRPVVGEAVCCTGIVSKECLDRFAISDTTVAAPANSCRVFSPSGKLLRLRKETPQAYVINRPAFDDALARKAQEAGADYFLSTKVAGVTLVDHRVRAEVEFRGKTRMVEGEVVIMSNGFGFSLPRRLGLGQVGDFVLGAQAEVSAVGVDDVEVYLGQDVAPGFFAWLVPTSPTRALVGVLSRRRPGLYMRRLLSKLFAQGKIASPEAEVNYGGIPLRPLPKTHGERMVVVGDAAGQVKPTTGGGIYYGLLCADVAVDTIHEAMCAGDFSARRLNSYEKRWRRMLGRDLLIGYWGRRLYEGLSDQRIDHIFDVIQSNGIHEELLQSPDFSFDWHGNSILSLVKHRAVRQAIWSMTKSVLPFRKTSQPDSGRR
ncbi:MAG: NAD(P)/FAD-dependent oxidoreductase [Dehalococcoidia bacterium]